MNAEELKKNKAAQKLGRLGGNTTLQKYGKKHFSEAGKLGMKKRWGKKKHSYLPGGSLSPQGSTSHKDN